MWVHAFEKITVADKVSFVQFLPLATSNNPATEQQIAAEFSKGGFFALNIMKGKKFIP